MPTNNFRIERSSPSVPGGSKRGKITDASIKPLLSFASGSKVVSPGGNRVCHSEIPSNSTKVFQKGQCYVGTNCQKRSVVGKRSAAVAEIVENILGTLANSAASVSNIFDSAAALSTELGTGYGGFQIGSGAVSAIKLGTSYDQANKKVMKDRKIMERISDDGETVAGKLNSKFAEAEIKKKVRHKQRPNLEEIFSNSSKEHVKTSKPTMNDLDPSRDRLKHLSELTEHGIQVSNLMTKYRVDKQNFQEVQKNIIPTSVQISSTLSYGASGITSGIATLATTSAALGGCGGLLAMGFSGYGIYKDIQEYRAIPKKSTLLRLDEQDFFQRATPEQKKLMERCEAKLPSRKRVLFALGVNSVNFTVGAIAAGAGIAAAAGAASAGIAIPVIIGVGCAVAVGVSIKRQYYKQQEKELDHSLLEEWTKNQAFVEGYLTFRGKDKNKVEECFNVMKTSSQQFQGLKKKDSLTKVEKKELKSHFQEAEKYMRLARQS